MQKERDYEDAEFSQAWRKIVANKGNPVPMDLKGKTQEQAINYANNCLRFLNDAKEKQTTTANNDKYWDAAATWWETRVEAINAYAKRAPTVPMPHLSQRYQPYPEGLPKYRRALGPLPVPKNSTAIRPLTPAPLETSYRGTAWTTAPLSTERTPQMAEDLFPLGTHLLVPRRKLSISKDTQCVPPPPSSPSYSEMTGDNDVVWGPNEEENKLKSPPVTPPPSPSDCNFSLGKVEDD
jgi:hypothetical protein